MLGKYALVERLDLQLMAVLLLIQGKMSAQRATSAHSSGHLPELKGSETWQEECCVHCHELKRSHIDVIKWSSSFLNPGRNDWFLHLHRLHKNARTRQRHPKPSGKSALFLQEDLLKLLYCAHCGDIVRLYAEKRSCQCGKSWGHYLEDGATTVQTYPSLSLGIANPDFETALKTFVENPRSFSPALAIRCWINPLSEPDVKFVPGEELEEQPHEESSEAEDENAPVGHEAIS